MFQEESKDTKVATRIRQSKKNKQHNDQKKKNKQHNDQKKNSIYLFLLRQDHS
jgi:anaerobic C4-dicarboxylate transporter